MIKDELAKVTRISCLQPIMSELRKGRYEVLEFSINGRCGSWKLGRCCYKQANAEQTYQANTLIVPKVLYSLETVIMRIRVKFT